MNFRNVLMWLVPVVAILALLGATVGLTMPGEAGPRAFTSVNGQTVELFGRGLYQNDTVFMAATFQALDLVTLAVFGPALTAAAWWCFRGSERGAVLLAGMLGVFLYNSASLALGAAYNPMFILYVALFGASFFAFVFALAAIDHYALADTVSARLPRRSLAAFLGIAGLAPVVLWLGDIFGAMLADRVPDLLGSYTTVYTYVVDLAIVVPATWLTALLLLRRTPVSYALAAVFLTLLASVGVGVIAATLRQTALGIAFSTGQYVGLIGSWIVLGAGAGGFLAALLRSLPDRPSEVLSAPRQGPSSMTPAIRALR